MKTSNFFALVLATALVVFTTSCQKEESNNVQVKPTTETIDPTQPVNIQSIPSTPALESKVEALITAHQSGSRNNPCTLGSDVGCDEVDQDVEAYINAFCANNGNLPGGTFTGNVTTMSFNISIYVDSDSDINLDQYETYFIAHYNIIKFMYPNLYFYMGDFSMPCRDRTYNTATVTYTILH